MLTRLRTGEWCHPKPTGVTEFTDKGFGSGLQDFAGGKKKKEKKAAYFASWIRNNSLLLPNRNRGH